MTTNKQVVRRCVNVEDPDLGTLLQLKVYTLEKLGRLRFATEA
jgi:hypothetical protein